MLRWACKRLLLLEPPREQEKGDECDGCSQTSSRNKAFQTGKVAETCPWSVSASLSSSCLSGAAFRRGYSVTLHCPWCMFRLLHRQLSSYRRGYSDSLAHTSVLDGFLEAGQLGPCSWESAERWPPVSLLCAAVSGAPRWFGF